MIKSKRKQTSNNLTVYGAMLHVVIVVGVLVALDVWFVCSVWFKGCIG